MAQSCSILIKIFITIFLLNFLFLSRPSYAEPPKRPSSADLPKLCNYDNFNYYKYGQALFDDIESCNVGLLRMCNVKEIYQLGDSISDVSNLMRERATTPFARLPYGTNFSGGPTGRPSNGRLMIDYFVDAIMAAVRRVSGFGARRVVVPGLYSIYRLPLFQTTFAANPDMYTLSEDLAHQHNIELRSAINKLTEEERRNAIVALGRMHTMACCGSGGGLYNFELSRMCGESGVSACADPDRHFSWDGLHLTQEAYRIMSKFMLYHFFLDLHCPYPA